MRAGHRRLTRRRTPRDRDVAGIATKRRDVGLHPLKPRLLVLEAVVASVQAERPIREESQQPESVLQRHEHNVAGLREMITRKLDRVSELEPATVDPHERPQMRTAGVRRGDHVQIQAILGRRRAVPLARRRVLQGRPGGGPHRGRLRRLPTERAQRWSGERDPQPLRQTVVGHKPTDRTGCGVDGGPGAAGRGRIGRRASEWRR